MDMRTDFKVVINEQEYKFKVETWQEAMREFLQACNRSGFTVDTDRQTRLIELATSGMVTVR